MAQILSGPQPLDWQVYAGDRNAEAFEVTANDPVDLTEAVIESQARVSATDPTIALTATVAPINLQLGQFSVEWDGEEVRELLGSEDKWTGVWDLQVTFAGDTLPVTILRGAFIAVHDVTRSGS